jgi:hypothetical protein
VSGINNLHLQLPVSTNSLHGHKLSLIELFLFGIKHGHNLPLSCLNLS